MCLIVFAHLVHADFPLVLSANRDEFYSRGSTPMHWWTQPDPILAGRDEIAGGTWLGASRNGAWAAVTNYREPNGNTQPAQSRGELVVEFLRSNVMLEQFAIQLNQSAGRYQGFNLLFGDGRQVFWFSNRADSDRAEAIALKPGVYGLSNHLIDTPWPKVELAKQRLSDRLVCSDIASDSLLDILQDTTIPADDQLPTTGVGLERERVLSSMFIADEDLQYGTRCTTAIKISRHRRFTVVERSYPDRSVVDFSFDAHV